MSIAQMLIPPAGAPQPLVLLHCSGSSGRQWDPMAAELAGRFEVLTPHLLGYGGTARWPISLSTSLDEEAEHLEPLIDADGVHLFGHSYGGAVALQIALRWPERVKSLTLYEPVRFALLFGRDDCAASATEIVTLARRAGDEVMEGDLHGAARRFADYWSGEGSFERMGTRRQINLAERMPKVQAEFDAAFSDTTPPARYRALTMPVHLIGGTTSPRPVRQVLDVIAERVPRAARTTLTGLGHMGPVEDPLRVLAAFDAPLRGLELEAAGA